MQKVIFGYSNFIGSGHFLIRQAIFRRARSNFARRRLSILCQIPNGQVKNFAESQ